LRAFALRRLFRIYPLYLAALAGALVGGVSGLLPQWSDLAHADVRRWIGNLLLVQDFTGQKAIIGVSWTLFIELTWYGLFAAALLIARQRAAQWLALLMPLCLLLLAGASLLLETRIPLSRPGLIYAAVIGFQAYRCWIGETTWRDLAVNLAIFILVTGVCNLVAFGHFRHPHVTLVQAAGPWLLAPLGFALTVFVAQRRPLTLMAQGILPAFGTASYSLYLLHPLVMAALFDWLPPSAAAVLAVPASALVALAAYRWIELPGISLGRRLAQGGVANRTAPA
jgi:peptidoglycan/LPS O-acetylase OafA/YrhL